MFVITNISGTDIAVDELGTNLAPGNKLEVKVLTEMLRYLQGVRAIAVSVPSIDAQILTITPKRKSKSQEVV